MTVLRPEFPDHSSPFSRDQERRRKVSAILSSAGKRFNEQGFAHTRLEDVAADLGLTKTSISYYFSSKEELAEAVFRAAAEFLGSAVDTAFQLKDAAAARIEALITVYAAQLSEAAKGRRPHLTTLRDLDALPAAVRGQITDRVCACVARINAELGAWAEAEDSSLARAEPATFLILALLDWMTERQSRHRRHDDALLDRDAVLDLVRHGLHARGAPPSQAMPLDFAGDETSAIFDRDARNKLKREAFLKAGSRLFNQKGFGGTSLAEVAASLGVSRGAFYYHIQDKEQFLDQCLERSLHIVERTLAQAMEDADLPELDRVHSALAELVYRQAVGVEPLLRPTMAAVLPAPRQRRHWTRLQNIARQLGDALTDGAAAGVVRPVDASLIEEILASVIFLNGGYAQAAAHSFDGWSFAEDPRASTADYLHLLLHGLRGPE